MIAIGNKHPERLAREFAKGWKLWIMGRPQRSNALAVEIEELLWAVILRERNKTRRKGGPDSV